MKMVYPKSPVIFLMGPTASGKTALATELFQTEKFEIISVDSTMVYQDLDIGSAKPNEKELQKTPHHLIDFIDPKESYSAAQFCHDAKELINAIHKKNKTPLLVGGTMLYYKALKDGLANLPDADKETRANLDKKLDEKGIEKLHQELRVCDPITANRLHEKDTQRILRALEVYYLTNKPLSKWHQEQQLEKLPNPVLSIALAPQNRSLLHQRIEKRFDEMMEQGFLGEVQKLFHRGDLDLNCPAMKSVGYRQIWQYLDGDLSLDEAKEKAVIATRQLAKRQYTWLRSWPNIFWYDSLSIDELSRAKAKMLSFIKEVSYS